MGEKKNTIGIITDGQIRRYNQKKIDLLSLKVKEIMTSKELLFGNSIAYLQFIKTIYVSKLSKMYRVSGRLDYAI